MNKGGKRSAPPSLLLVARAQLGDLHALDELLRILQKPLHRYLTHLVGDESAAEDLLQESMMVIYRKLGELREPLWFRAWAYRIATRLAHRHLRRAKRFPEAFDQSEVERLPDEVLIPTLDPDELARLHETLDGAPAKSQLVLRMHYLDQLTHAEIAEALDVSVGTVKSRLAYGLSWMRAQISP